MAAGLLLMTGTLMAAASASASGPLPSGAPTVAGGTWSTDAGAKGLGRDLATATLLADGRILVAGERDTQRYAGYPQRYLLAEASSGLWDPASAKWKPLPDMPAPRSGHAAALLPDGSVMILGGATLSLATYRPEDATSVDLFDPGKGRWSTTDPMSSERLGPSAVALDDGSVLAVGGGLVPDHSAGISRPGPATERWSSGKHRWSASGKMHQARFDQTATLLADGMVLVAGGEGTLRALSSAELFDPTTATWSDAAAMLEPRARHQAVRMPDGRVLVAGGYGANGITGSAEIYDPGNATWTTAGQMSVARDRFALVVLPDGRVVALGGGGPAGGDPYAPLDNVDIYDPATNTWAAATPMPEPRWGLAAVALTDGRVVVIGGDSVLSGEVARQRRPDDVLLFTPPAALPDG